ncbi:MAG: NADH-quinone oxidoreductase subunit L [Rhodomicrobium sp.]
MYPAIVLMPLAGALIAGFFGRILGDKASGILTSLLVVAGAVLSWIAFYRVGILGEETRIALLPWIGVGDLQASWALRIDTLTAVMLVVVNTVSALVHIYSIGYMSEDDRQPLFFAELSLFTFAMLSLVTADNFVQMFFGWEGVGLASYLLIGFWYHRPSANSAAIKAFVVNRVGDFGFALGIFAVFYVFRDASFDTVFAAASEKKTLMLPVFGYQADALTVICLLLFMGAMGKSAQFLLHTWLPDAMEGPTPVSALIHAATMVTAGVFMVARLSPLFELSPTALWVVTLVGATTAFFAGTVGVAQNDIKRVIAYSTCSQLGYMFAALGLRAYSAGIFHLFTHAFFKALLFLGAGSVIHALHGEQDLRKMGGLRKAIPFTFAMMLAGTLSLTGFPYTAGYFSKDAIIDVAHASHAQGAEYAYWSLVIVAFLTSFYSWRLMFMAFFGKPHDEHAFEHAHESPPVMTGPLLLLAIGALGAGIVFAPYFVEDLYTKFWRGALFTLPDNSILSDSHNTESLLIKWMPSLMMLGGFALAYIAYVAVPALPAWTVRNFKPIHAFLYNKWYFDELYHLIFVRPTRWIARVLWIYGDGMIIDGLGPDGVAARVTGMAKRAVRFQTGYVYQYAFVMLIGVVALVSYFAYLFSGALFKL